MPSVWLERELLVAGTEHLSGTEYQSAIYAQQPAWCLALSWHSVSVAQLRKEKCWGSKAPQSGVVLLRLPKDCSGKGAWDGPAGGTAVGPVPRRSLMPSGRPPE